MSVSTRLRDAAKLLGAVGGIVLAVSIKVAVAGELAALVTEVTISRPALQPDTILAPGQSFNLGSNGRVVLAYFESCVLETIQGGHFTVGTEHSEVTDGEVNRTTFDCLGKDGMIAAGPDAEAGGAYSRSPLEPPVVATTQPILLVPGIEAGRKIHLTISRLDAKAEPLSLDSVGPVLDLMRIQAALALGGKYKAEVDDRSTTFRVANDPSPGGISTFGRIVVLK